MSDSEGLIHRVSQALLGMQRHAWEQGTAAQAFLELGESDVVAAMARDAVVRQLPDGRLGMIGTPECSTDPAANGEPVLYAARLGGDADLLAAAERQLDWLLRQAPRSPEGVLYHHTHTRQIWVDSFYMAPPFLAVAGHPREAVEQIEGFRRALWDPRKQLFHHIWDDDLQTYARAPYWGVGNGWAAAGMTRVLAALPQDMSQERDRLILYIREVVEGCLAHLRPDGLFHDFVDDPTTFVETNLAQMISYTIYRGITAGWLESTFLEPAHRMRGAARAKVDHYGFVQGVCGSPHFDHPGVAPEGQAFFLLMESAARALAPA
jgi:unsaturated rhamnogalacturonyl hydrolase